MSKQPSAPAAVDTLLLQRSASPAIGWSALLPVIYLGAIAVAEIATRAGNPGIGLTLYAITLIVVLNQAAASAGPERALFLAVAIVPLERILSLTLPLETVGRVYSYILVALPTVIGIVLVARLVRYSRRDLGLVVDGRVVVLSLALVPAGVLLGFVYYWIIRPLPLVNELRVADLLAPVVALGLTTGLVEEMLFRGLLQRAAGRRLGPLRGILYVAVLYTLLAAVPWTAVVIAVVFITALGLAALTTYTGSVVPAATYHASLSVGLLLVAAFVVPGSTFT